MSNTPVTQTLTDEQALSTLPECEHSFYRALRSAYSPQAALRYILQHAAHEHRIDNRAGLPDYDDEV